MFRRHITLCEPALPDLQITEVLRLLLTFSQGDMPWKEPSHAALRGNTMAFTRLGAPTFGESLRNFGQMLPCERSAKSCAGNLGVSSMGIDTLFILKSRTQPPKVRLGGFTSYEPYEPRRDMNLVLRHDPNIEIPSTPRQDFS